MKQAPLPPDESLRLAALASLDLLDTPPEERFDRITRLACRLFDVPIALVSLVDTDRQWFKSGEGFSVTETPRDIAFCGHTILDQRIMIVPDATVDARFADNPLVTGKDQIRFYAGCPLSAPDGSRVGAFCIKGREPRQLSDEDQVLLKGLAEMVETEIRVSDEVNRRTRAETESDEALIKAGVLDRAWAEIVRMQQSEDLLNVLDGMLKDLVEADVVFDLCVINIIDEAAEERRQYGATPQGWCGQSDTPLSEVSRQFMTLWRKGELFIRKVDDRLAKSCEKTRQEIGVIGEMARPTAVVDAPFADGTLSLQTHHPEGFSERDVAIVETFSHVVELGYSRYLDFQKLEWQAVVLQREQVLERLRDQAQAMQSSEDIKLVVEAVYRELKELGLQLTSSSIGIFLSDTEVEIWPTGEDGRALEPFVTERPPEASLEEARRRGVDYHHLHVEGDEVKQVVRQLISRGNPRWKGVPEDRWPEKLNSYSIFFKRGWVRVASEEAIDEEYMMLIKRFGDAFGFAHSREGELKQKEAQNLRLAVDAAVQRLRAEVQGMERAEDFENILSRMADDLKSAGLDFQTCGIDVLDTISEQPSLAYFEENSFSYTGYTIDPRGKVTSERYSIPSPFQPVTREAIERFIEGVPWQGTSEATAIVEVPASSYGRLRLTTDRQDRFDDDQVNTLQEFATAVGLGYARYLDFQHLEEANREIQTQTDRKSIFLASMSHELRTPMNAIKGFTNMVLRRGKDELSERNLQNLEKVDQASDHLLGMINDLLDLSKIEAGRMDANPETFDVAKLVDLCASTVSPLVQEGVELCQEVEDVGEVCTDKGRLQQMTINLLSNAIKFTDAGTVTVRAERSQDQLVVSVTDTGKGIPADELPSIFDEYRQAKGSENVVQKGTGLGLSITKKFAELLGGTIKVESEIDKGSTFTITIPSTYRA